MWYKWAQSFQAMIIMHRLILMYIYLTPKTGETQDCEKNPAVFKQSTLLNLRPHEGLPFILLESPFHLFKDCFLSFSPPSMRLFLCWPRPDRSLMFLTLLLPSVFPAPPRHSSKKPALCFAAAFTGPLSCSIKTSGLIWCYCIQKNVFRGTLGGAVGGS